MAELMQDFVYKVEVEPGADFVTMTWKGYATTPQFREGTEKMLESLIRHHKHKVLGDVLDMVLISQEDQNWLTGYFVPKAIENGMRFLALVKPAHYFNKVAVETVAYKVYGEKLCIQFFDSSAEAREWLSGAGIP